MTTNGGDAFPRVKEVRMHSGEIITAGGMTLLDWFAGQALIGLCQADMSEEEFEADPDLLARTAYRMAKAMLAARPAS